MGNPTMMPLTEQWHDGGFLVSEANGHQSRDQVTLTGGMLTLAGTVLGQISATAAPSATVTPGATNTGNGALTVGTQPVAGETPAGIYTATFTGANTYDVSGPGGLLDRDQQVASNFDADGMVFSIAAGATPFVAGDTFTIAVAMPGTAGAWAPWNPAAADGSQVAAGVIFATKNATTGDCPALAITRNAEVNASELIWPPAATQAQIVAATAQLQKVGILAR
ncbi:head decoration protein [Paraburkholderia sp. BR14263]|uniref:head decoration protein n=1 Tax=unclassified Paraburkholderia TaxID=2615204 RepID=UPI0034CF433C